MAKKKKVFPANIGGSKVGPMSKVIRKGKGTTPRGGMSGC